MEFAGIYARSSLGRAKQGDTVEHQVEMIKEFAKRSNLNVIFDDRFIYEDDGDSAYKTTLLQRSSMKRMIEDIDKGLIKWVFFKGISRFARDSAESISTAKRLNNKGVRVISLEENYDSFRDDPTMFQIYSVMAEQESRKTSIRVSLGNKQKARNGLWSGTIPPLGYVKIKDLQDEELKKTLLSEGKHPHSLYPDGYAHIINKIFTMFVHEDMGRKKIVSYLNDMGYRTNRGKVFQEKHVVDILRNRVYVGDIVYGKTRYNYVEDEERKKKIQVTVHVDEEDWAIKENAHPPIIDRKLFEMAQNKLDVNKNKFNFGRRFNAARHPLTGLLKCNKCGSPMICQKRTNTKKDGTKLEYRYYVCSTYHRKGRHVCDQANINADSIEEKIYTKIQQALKNEVEKWKYEDVKVKEDENKKLEEELKQLELVLEKKVNASKTLLESRDIYDLETFIELNSQLQNEIKTIKQQREKIKEQLKNKSGSQGIDIRETYEKFKGLLPDDIDARRKAFHLILNEVAVEDSLIKKVSAKINLSL